MLVVELPESQIATAAFAAGSRMATAEHYTQRRHPQHPQYVTFQGTSVRVGAFCFFVPRSAPKFQK